MRFIGIAVFFAVFCGHTAFAQAQNAKTLQGATARPNAVAPKVAANYPLRGLRVGAVSASIFEEYDGDNHSPSCKEDTEWIQVVIRGAMIYGGIRTNPTEKGRDLEVVVQCQYQKSAKNKEDSLEGITLILSSADFSIFLFQEAQVGSGKEDELDAINKAAVSLVKEMGKQWVAQGSPTA